MSPQDGIDNFASEILSSGLTRQQLLRRGAALGISVAGLSALLDAAAALGAADPAADQGVNRAVSGDITVIFNAGAGVEQDAWDARTAAFTKKFPNVNVKPAHAEGTFYDIVPKVLTLIAGGQAPDVVRTGNYTTAEFGVRDALVPLNSLIKKDKTLHWNDFVGRARSAMTVGGQVYALPENNEVYGIHYNSDLFKAKGLPDPRTLENQGKWTKAAFLKAAQALTSGSGAGKKFGFLYETWNSENWIFFNNGAVLAPDGKTVLVDKPAAVNALQFAADLTNKYGVSPNPQELAGRTPQQLFLDGTCAMFLTGGWGIADLSKAPFNYNTVGAPRFAGSKPVSKMEISGYAITKASRNKEAAWEYIKFITGPVAQSIWTVTGMPSRQSVIKQFAAGKAPGSKYAPFYKPFLATLSNARWTPFVAKSAEVAQDVTSATAPMWLGSQTAQQACSSLASQLRTLLK